jgi:hypothetical protein
MVSRTHFSPSKKYKQDHHTNPCNNQPTTTQHNHPSKTPNLTQTSPSIAPATPKPTTHNPYTNSPTK